MRESRVIALAGVFQACSLVRSLANDGRCEAAAAESSLASVFRIDSDSAADVFGGLAGIRLGMECLVANLDSADRDAAIARLVVGVMRLERKLVSRSDMRRQVLEGIESIQRQVDHLGVAHATVQARLAELYSNTLSTLRPRIVVHGNPAQLSDPRRVEQIRSLLFAGVRAAVLWRQVGGSQWRLLLRRSEYAMLARGLLTRCTLDRG
ncbi:MAG TPA: high frequency lysogenization protein HflD [Dokdonella sp.]|uniref:high frequency lysogenization protein HflD n=1 Tax=Dokdonella sp. TaxID=2291710 RepID=UPI002C62DF8C|nr:high frequency lysogenization protein HflD [Dokdonella sp.]HOX71454.1 high frequency lysogenization protein HflD [Dokdonella sp.]HPG94814.1 high frequency lysogenization protein HflD [Dokdonella sp.]HPN79237.1 high frequency lysogenization protein HflD [Dokdonella sp.]